MRQGLSPACLPRHGISPGRRKQRRNGRVLPPSLTILMMRSSVSRWMASLRAGMPEQRGSTDIQPQKQSGGTSQCSSRPTRSTTSSKILDTFRHGEAVHHHETVRIGKNGNQVQVSLTVSPIRDRDGELTGASTIAHDITERKMAEETDPARQCLQPEPDRGESRPARHHQSGRHDQRRERRNAEGNRVFPGRI